MTWLAYRMLRLVGWRFAGALPPVPKMIVIGAPHTTNWDFILFLGALRAYDFKAHYIAKHTLFRRPYGWFFRMLGGIPVDRTKPGGMVRQVADAFSRSERMILVMAPEGTRKAAPHWRSGFLNIAREAGVPIVLAAVDFPGKTVTLGPTIDYDGDPGAFMDRARQFYREGRGLHPEGAGPVTVREEG